MAIKPNQYVESLQAYEITPQQPWLDYEVENVLKLDWNEGDNVPSFVKEIASECLKRNQFFSWYPDYSAIELHEKLAHFLGVSTNNILSFPGSDTALETVCRAYLEPGDCVVVVTPGYENFDVYAKSMGASCVNFNVIKPFRFDIDIFLNQIGRLSPKMIYLTSPNNPCGYTIDLNDISRLCARFSNTLIVCDQAYVEFSLSNCCIPLTRQFENLVVVRTFSKAFSLAGIRLGYTVANHDVLKILAKLRNGKNITMLSQKVAVESLRHFDQVELWIQKVIAVREWLKGRLTQLGIQVYDSQANFLLFEAPDPIKLILALKRNNIYVRDKSKSTSGCLRVTITTGESAEKFYSVVEQVMKLEYSEAYAVGANVGVNV